MRVKTTFTAEVNPTEDEEKVQTALLNLAGPGAKLERRVEAGRVTLLSEGEGLESLGKLRSMLEAQRIRDAARLVLARSIRGSRIRVAFNRQAAFVGKASFSESPGESPLGPIEVEVETDDPYEAIDWVAPPPGRRGLRA
ncbi:MAG: RNA-binding domain-containing protein [Candidatus Bathyarchaeia archaeon]